MNKKLLIFISICILFFIGGCPLPFNVAICGNDVCETGEETVCPGDCPTEVSLTDDDGLDDETETTDTTSTTTSQTYSDVTNTTTTSSDVTNTTTSSNVTNTTNTTTSSTTQTSSEEDDDDDDDHRHYSKSSTTTTTSTTSIHCTHKWQCTGWNPCEENGMQTRICYYVGNCTTEGNQSDTRQRCTYVAPEQEEYIPEEEVYPTCYDGIKNQGEKGIDCDGPCPACEVPQVQEPQSNTLYVVLAIGLLLLIIAALGYIFRNKWMPYWEKIKSTFVKPKPQPMQFRQFPQRPQYQQPQQYRRY